MKINKEQYDNIIDRISDISKTYLSESNDYKYNNYLLYLANGDQIKYSFNDNNIPHLLGIDFSALISRNEIRKADSVDMLNQVLDNPYKYWTLLYNKIQPSDIFSEYIEDKIENFRLQQLVPYPNQLYFVCKYDRAKAYGVKEIDGLNADYYIARKNEIGDIVLLGLVKKDDYYVPQTSRIIKNDENFIENMENFLCNQEITYATGLCFRCQKTHYSRNVNLNVLETIDTLQKIDELANSTNAIPNTISGHIYNLRILSKRQSDRYDTRKILASITDKIKNRELIQLSEEELSILDASVLPIIDEYNDSLFNTNVSDENVDKYSSLKSSNENLKQELEEKEKTIIKQKEELLKLKEQLQEQYKLNQELEEEKDKFGELKESILTLTKTF